MFTLMSGPSMDVSSLDMGTTPVTGYNNVKKRKSDCNIIDHHNIAVARYLPCGVGALFLHNLGDII